MLSRIGLNLSPAAPSVGLLSLPLELLMHELIPRMNVATFCGLLQTCKALNELSTNNDIWKMILNQQFSSNWPSLLSKEDEAELEALQLGSLLQPAPGIYRKIYSWISVPEASFDVCRTKTEPEPTHIVKITVLGSSGVGKTCLIDRAIYYRFRPYVRCGISSDFWTQMYEPVGPDKNFEDFPNEPLRSVRAQFWDTAGQERFQAIGTYYYRGTDATLLCFSLLDQKSFEAIETVWIPQIREKCSPHCQLVLVGLKCDRPDSERQVSRSEARALATKIGCKYIECSSKEDINVRRVMAHVVTRAVKSLRLSARNNPQPAVPAGSQQHASIYQQYLLGPWNWIKSKLLFW